MQVPPSRQADQTEFTNLIERIRGGDERALEKLLMGFAIPLRRMADKLIGNTLRPHLDAEDLVQAVSIILWRELREGKFEVANPQQLIRLAGTLLKRQAARAVRRLKSTLAMGATFEGNLNATVSDGPLVPASSVADKVARKDQIRDLLERVSDLDRWMLELLLLGHTIAATARILGVEPATLRMRLSRLRVRLREGKRVDNPLE